MLDEKWYKKYGPFIITILIVGGLLFWNSYGINEISDYQINGIVDSIDKFPGIFEPQVNYFWVNAIKYKISERYYGDFIRYLQIGDSLSSDLGESDIYVYRKINQQIVKKYFLGSKKK